MAKHNCLDDFRVLFAHLWYRDFPVDPVYRQSTTGRTDWTIHIGNVVRACAALEGWHAEFEKSRTDGRILRPTFPDTAGAESQLEEVAALEWEWYALHTKPKEIGILNKKHLPPDGFACFIGYADAETLSQDLAWCVSQWTSDQPLLAILVSYTGSIRSFRDLHFFRIEKGKEPQELWSQRALPWEVEGTLWSVKKSA